MDSKVQAHVDENKENEFIDFMVGAGVFGGTMFAIFIVAVIVKMLYF